MDERRKHRRYKSGLLVTTIYRNEQDRVVTLDSILSEDIGIGGVRVVFPKRLPKGKVLDLKVFLFSDPIHLPAKGKVVWSAQKEVLELAARDSDIALPQELYWVGIQFVDIDSFHRERILRWIKKQFNVKEL